MEDNTKRNYRCLGVTHDNPMIPKYWRPLPTVPTGGDTEIIGRFDPALYGRSDCAFKITTASGDYTVDWGDGTVHTYASGEVASHDYGAGVFTVRVTGDMRGYYAGFRYGVENLYVTGLHELNFYGIGWNATYMPYSEVLLYNEHDEIPMESCENVFMYCRDIHITKTFSNSTNITRAFYGAGNIVLPTATMDNVTSSAYAWFYAKNVTAPLVTLEKLDYGVYTFLSYGGINTPSLNLNSLTNGKNMFYGAKDISKYMSFKFPSLTNGYGMFYGASSVSVEQLRELLNSLPDRTDEDTSPTIDIRYTAGCNQLTDDDKEQAINRNWSILIA